MVVHSNTIQYMWKHYIMALYTLLITNQLSFNIVCNMSVSIHSPSSVPCTLKEREREHLQWYVIMESVYCHPGSSSGVDNF